MSKPQISYTVRAELPSEHVATEFLNWLTDGHIQGVLAGGASTATVVRLAPDETAPTAHPNGIVVLIHYTFPNQDTYDRYATGAAIALRQEGKARFIDTHGVIMSRTLGSVHAVLPLPHNSH